MFIEFKKKLQKHVAELLQHQQMLFVTDIDKDQLWEIYLKSFPLGTNEIFRKRKEYDCSCCRHFIKSFGNVIVIINNKLISIWDFDADSTKYQPVIDALAEYVKSMPVQDVFVTKESMFGTDHNHEMTPEGNAHTWDHFMIKLPNRFITKLHDTMPTERGNYRTVRGVFKRSLEEISSEAIETVLDLIANKSLHKGDEWQVPLTHFLILHKDYHALPDDEKAAYCWSKSVEVGGSIGKIKNHSIGTLLLDVTNDIDLNVAVRKWGNVVDPCNYKHPKAIYSKKQVDQFEKEITELGFRDSLYRRHATINDIMINNILFVDKTIAKHLIDDIFFDLKHDAIVITKNFSKVEEVTIEHFISHILPRTINLKLYLENQHAPNLMSVVAPKIPGCKSMFKWSNNFTWAYDKNLTDSMKERVKAAGGKVDGVLRASNQWNDGVTYNPNDFDIHCIEPNGNHIYYSNKYPIIHPSTGRLDVDIIHPDKGVVAVENIIWTDINKMQEGTYRFFIRNYAYRGGLGGFKAEIEYDGQIHSYEYNKPLRQDEDVEIATLQFTKANGVYFIKSLPLSTSSKVMWNLTTNQFHPVSVCMFSPNHWDGQKGQGHKHYFFILDQCRNPDRPNGFFNEFLAEDLLLKHKRIFEALGSKMRVEPSDDQLSGVGFSSTKRNSVVCRVEGHIARTLKITF